MVLQKRLGYEFNGYRVPNVPRGSRSIRGKRMVRKRVAQNEMCAFELLASVAGELLLQKESSTAQCGEREIRDERKSGSKFYESEQSSLFSEIVLVSDPPKKESGFNRVKSEFPTKAALEEQMEADLKPHQFVSSCSSIGMEKVGSKTFRSQRIVDRRIRKLFASKFWEFSDNEGDGKPFFYGRKMYYKRQQAQRFSFKRKKLFRRGSISSSDLPISPQTHIKGEASSSDTGVHGGGGEMSSSTDAQKFAFDSNDYRVKLSIKSFKVPELVIEIPETATVGSLKRTVMDAVTAILGGGLRVGVHMQGEIVRDDSKTLVQAGICHGEELDSLGFTLEPNSLPSPKQHVSIDHVPVCDSPQPLKRLLPVRNSGGSTLAEGDLAGVQSPEAVSNALVAVHAADLDALAMFPVNGKVRRSEASQRRVRRPFSVSEVEALVHAVEKLGTGRWRDVKLCAFDGSKHRTYVDLKDKWKTLVHTAKIPPQRRRGEPVPQELLDRVLSVHAYWSERQQPKPDTSPRLLPELGAQFNPQYEDETETSKMVNT